MSNRWTTVPLRSSTRGTWGWRQERPRLLPGEHKHKLRAGTRGSRGGTFHSRCFLRHKFQSLWKHWHQRDRVGCPAKSVLIPKCQSPSDIIEERDAVRVPEADAGAEARPAQYHGGAGHHGVRPDRQRQDRGIPDPCDTSAPAAGGRGGCQCQR